MADYTHINLRDVEDAAPKFGMAPDLSARFARTALGLQKSGVSLMRIAPGVRAPFGHLHHEQEEVYVVVAGGGRVKVEDDVVELRTWDAVRIPPETTRAVEAGADGIEYLAFGAPSGQWRENLADEAEMKPGWWTD